MFKFSSILISLLLITSLGWSQNNLRLTPRSNILNNDSRAKAIDESRVLNELPSTVEKYFDTNFIRNRSQTRSVPPASYDLRIIENGAYLSPVRDQGLEGACWSFATYGAVESYWLKQGLPQFDLSEQNLATCHGWDLTPSDGGNYDLSMSYLSRISGPITENDDPYTLPANPNCVSGLTPTSYYINQARYLPGSSSEAFDPTIIKQALMENGALYVNLFYDSDCQNYSDYTYYYNGSEGTNHAVILVGWDDNKIVTGGEYATPSSPGAWIIRNSWGANWGESGYFYVSYEDTEVLTSVAYFPANEPYEANADIYGYDELGWIRSFGATSTGDNYSLVKFTSTSMDSLKSVGTYITGTNTQVEIKIFDDFDGTNLSNELASKTSEICAWPGYYTFDLDSPISVSTGNDFYVQIKYVCDYYYSIPVERSSSYSYTSNATIETGKCWYKTTSSNWDAMGADQYYDYDICTKVYTIPEVAAIPVANFAAANSDIIAGESVSFIDQSSGIPQSWSWTFEGADVTTSDEQNPEVTWSQAGIYTVSLTVSNSLGTDEITKTNYITIKVNCSEQSNFTEEDNYANYAVDNGFALGHNPNKVCQYAEKFTNPIQPNLSGAIFTFNIISETSNTNPKVCIKVWDEGNNGLPGELLHSQDLYYSDINSEYFTQVDFDNQVPINDVYFIGYEIYYQNIDTINHYCSKIIENDPSEINTIYSYTEEQGWTHTAETFGDSFNSSLAITSIVCSNAPIVPAANFDLMSNDICLGNESEFTNQSTVGSEGDYNWDFGDGQTSTEENPLHTYQTEGNYTISLSIIYEGETLTYSEIVTVHNNPTLSLGNDIAICDGENHTLQAVNDMENYTWSNGENTQEIIVNQEGNYTLTITDEFGCTATDEISVTVNQLPNINLGDNQTVCGLSTEITLDAGSQNSYAWSDGSINQSLLINTAGTYSVTVTNENNCSNSDTITISYTEFPTLSLCDDISICPESLPYSIEGSEASSYQWSNGETTQDITISEADTYSLTITDENGCTAMDEFTLTIYATPEISLGENITSCTYDIPVLINAETDETSINWSTGETSQEISVEEEGTYSVTVTDINGCINSDEINVSIVNPPTVNLGDDLSICQNQDVIEISPEGNSSYTYTWSDDSNNQSLEINSAGTYSVTVTDENNCSASDEITINYYDPISLSLEEDVSICPESLPYSLQGEEADMYEWSNGANTQNITISTADTYTLTITDENGCTASDDFTLNVYPSPTVELPEEFITCDSELPINITAETSETSITWSTGESTPSITVNEEGIFTVTVSNEEGCITSKDVEVEIVPAPIIELGENFSLCQNQAPIEICPELNTVYPYAYLWSNEETTSSIEINESGTYSVTVSVANCETKDSITITVNPDPQVFNISGGGLIPADGNTSIKLDGSENGVTYTLCINNIPTNLIKEGTGEALTFENLTSIGIYTISATFPETNCDQLMNGEIEIGFNSINSENSCRINLYPNPVENILSIESSEEIKNIRIYSTDGRLIKSINGNRNEIVFNNLPKAVYFVKVETNVNTSIHRIIKK